MPNTSVCYFVHEMRGMVYADKLLVIFSHVYPLFLCRRSSYSSLEKVVRL